VTRISPLVLVAFACALAAAPVFGAEPGISQAAIGEAKLGLSAAGYARSLAEKPAVTHYADGTSRLYFSKAEISVLLARSGRGVVVSTEAGKYKLPGGIGPCDSVTRLLKAYRPVPRHMIQPVGSGPVVYQLRHLWFTTVAGRVGRVSLVSGSPSIQSLVNAAQCGTGEEGSHG
jgi:hypothetical protein